MLERRRPEHVKLVRRLVLLAQSLDQPAGHRAERHVILGAGPADHQEDADRPRLGTGQLGLLGRFGVSAGERGGAERQRDVGVRVADQLPGDGRGPFDRGDDLNVGVVKLFSQLGPHVASFVGVKHLVEQVPADLGNPLLDAGRDFRGGVLGELQVVLQVPAQVGLDLVVEGETERLRGRLPRRLLHLEFQVDAIVVLTPSIRLSDTKPGHVPLLSPSGA